MRPAQNFTRHQMLSKCDQPRHESLLATAAETRAACWTNGHAIYTFKKERNWLNSNACLGWVAAAPAVCTANIDLVVVLSTDGIEARVIHLVDVSAIINSRLRPVFKALRASLKTALTWTPLVLFLFQIFRFAATLIVSELNKFVGIRVLARFFL